MAIFIKNLTKVIDHKALWVTFFVFGNLLSCEVAKNLNDQLKGDGFVQFEHEDYAQKAIEKLNDKQVYARLFPYKQEREIEISKNKFNKVYVKNISKAMIEEGLQKTFVEFGTTSSVMVMRDADGKLKCLGFVNFENVSVAANVIETF